MLSLGVGGEYNWGGEAAFSGGLSLDVFGWKPFQANFNFVPRADGSGGVNLSGIGLAFNPISFGGALSLMVPAVPGSKPGGSNANGGSCTAVFVGHYYYICGPDNIVSWFYESIQVTGRNCGAEGVEYALSDGRWKRRWRRRRKWRLGRFRRRR